MTTVTGLILRTDGTVDELVIDNALEPLQKAVGGYIEVLSLGPDAVLIINEEGKLYGLERNANATVVARAMVGIATDDYIAGTALVLGQSRDGDFTDMPGDLRMAISIATATPGMRVIK